jgi:hypothetical protein
MWWPASAIATATAALNREQEPQGTTGLSSSGDDETERLRRFLALLAPLLSSVVAQPTKATRRRADRLRRIAEHFLAAGQDAYGEGDVLSELNAEATLRYVIALEALLAGDDDKTELSRTIIQRAAILAGVNDTDRKTVAETVRATYTARSSYAHGGETNDTDLPALRRVVRDCILARLILGDPVADTTSLGKHADLALLDHASPTKSGTASMTSGPRSTHRDGSKIASSDRTYQWSRKRDRYLQAARAPVPESAGELILSHPRVQQPGRSLSSALTLSTLRTTLPTGQAASVTRLPRRAATAQEQGQA